ncbi:hypothetical protein [Pseudonocardia sp. ICBG1293]|uniref:hypothetical protein n=1 Tax=Pseudonocardia sp. ICBG1293 TaxID=2844382 RepID=UPI001CCB2D2B|nr:hypothetical protein [Pseudonocardia sp. ICBG1293]
MSGRVRELVRRIAVEAFGAAESEVPIPGFTVFTDRRLDDPLAGIRAALLVHTVAESQLTEYARAARAAGRSWDQIADALGITTDEVAVVGEAVFDWLVCGRARTRSRTGCARSGRRARTGAARPATAWSPTTARSRATRQQRGRPRQGLHPPHRRGAVVERGADGLMEILFSSTALVLGVFAAGALLAWSRGARALAAGLAVVALLPAATIVTALSWPALVAVVGLAGVIVWHRWSRSSATVSRWAARSRRKVGVASSLDIVRHAGTLAVRRRTATVRPSLAARRGGSGFGLPPPRRRWSCVAPACCGCGRWSRTW